MPSMLRNTVLAVALGVATWGRPADAAFIFTAVEQGSDVVFTGTGSLNLSGLVLCCHDIFMLPPGFLFPQIGSLRAGTLPEINGGHEIDEYDFAIGPFSFGPGGISQTSNATGPSVGVSLGTSIEVPFGYVSGTALSDSMTFANQTFASLGLIPGTYVWNWPSDSLTLQIGQVPEPASLALLTSGLLALAGIWRAARRFNKT